MTTTKRNYTPEEFVQAWQTSKDKNEVRQKLKLTDEDNSIGSFANFLRSKKIPLKSLARASKFDYPSLIKLANKYLEYGRLTVKKGG